MRTLALTGLALLAMTGCNGGQPRLWRVAMDMSPLRSIADPSCFRGNNLPSGQGQSSETNYRVQSEWVVWDGADGAQFLDIGSQTFSLGHAPTITVSDLIESTPSAPRIFSAQRTVVSPYPGVDATESRRTQIIVTFSDYGVAPTGTVGLTAEYGCINGRAPCPNPNLQTDSVTCRSQLNFVGRRIDSSNTTIYGNTGS